MRILFDHPRRAAWRLERLTWRDGLVQFRTGTQGRWNPHVQAPVGAVLDRVPNCVFEAAFRLGEDWRAAACFKLVEQASADDPRALPIYASVACMTRILLAMTAGALRFENGNIGGLFTFAKQGTEIVLRPWEDIRPARLAAACDAPDVTAILAALPPPGKR